MQELNLFHQHTGIWEGTYTKIAPDGTMIDRHNSRLTLRLTGNAWSQTNEYTWADGRREFHDFGTNYFDDKGVMTYDNARIYGEAWEDKQNIILWWTYKEMPGSKLFEIITMIGEGHRMRTWQHSRNGVFEGLTMIEERQVKKQSEL